MGFQLPKRGLFFLGMALLFLPEAEARMDSIPGPRYTAARGAALGDAILSLADTAGQGLFYNPAALGRIKHDHFSPLNFSIMANNDYFKVLSISNLLKGHSLDSYAPSLAQNIGDRPGMGTYLLPSVAFKGFGFGLLIDADMNAIDNGTTITYRSSYKVIPALGYALRLARGIVKVGYSLQWVNKSEGQISVPNTNTTLGYNQSIADGSGFSHNLGVALDYPVQLNPSFNLVLRNIGGVSYRSSTLYSFAQNASGVPDDEEMSFDFELGLTPRFRKGGSMTITAAWRDITNRSGYSLLRKIAGGIEFVYRDILHFRMGYGAGYPTLGIALKRQKAEFSLSWWSELIGSSTNLQRDIRMMLNYQIRIF